MQHRISLSTALFLAVATHKNNYKKINIKPEVTGINIMAKSNQFDAKSKCFVNEKGSIINLDGALV